MDAALGDTVLKNGMQHNDIKVLQEELKNIGYFKGNEFTTYYDDITVNTVKNFQATYGLEQDGIFGPYTHAMLKALSESRVVDTKPTITTTPQVQTLKSIDLNYTRDLKLNISGRDVNNLQEGLKELGYLVIENTTDFFGPQTMKAVSTFQESYSITENGIADSHTIEMLNNVLTTRDQTIATPTRGNINRSKTSDLIYTAMEYLGVAYEFGGSTPKAFDCSGFTQFVYREHGINIPRLTVNQATVGTELSKSELQVGDLIIFSNTYKSGPSHTGIYMGNGEFIHSGSYQGGGVIISDLNSKYYNDRFSYGRRVF